MRSLRRRSLLAAALPIAAGEPLIAGPALNARARRKGLFFGTAVGDETLAREPDAMARVDAECGMVVAEATFKRAALQPQPDSYDFSRADALMDWAAKRRIRVRGHTLVWHAGNPDWLEPALTPATAEQLLTRYIQTVAGHTAGRLAHWDVVNEVINVPDQKPRALRDSPWLRALGPAYIDLAFHATASADPQALRVLNEFGVDYALDWQNRRRGALLDLLADLTHRGIPVQAVGLQAHLDAGETTLDQTILSRFIADIASMGLKIIVTEFDVRDQRLPADIATRDAAIASHARAWLDAVLPNPNVLGLLTWGLSDRRSWLNELFPRPDKLPQRPLPLDTNLRRKKLWSTLAAAFDAAPARG